MHRRKSLVLLLGMVLSISGSSTIGASAEAAFTIEGRVRTVQDGDTLTVIAKNGARFPIRLADLDAPEISHRSNSGDKAQRRIRPGQVHGRAAHVSLLELAPIGSNVRAQCYEKDRYGRLICHIWRGKRNVNAEQLRRGWAMLPIQRKWIHDAASEHAQKEARLAKRGIWADKTPVHPDEWRRRCWRLGECLGAEVS